MKVYINRVEDYYYPILYVLKTIEKNKSFSFEFIDSAENAGIIWDHLNQKSQPIHLPFYESLKTRQHELSNSIYFDSVPFIRTDDGQKDVIATIFYMINCLQEFNPKNKSLDQFGRFKYESSYQSHFNNIEENLVQQEIDSFLKEHRINGTDKESTFFISHDIDSLYGSLMQDGFWALKKMKVGAILTLITSELIRKPHWKNIDKILRINNEYDIRSTFFWIVNEGMGTRNIKNADYYIQKEQGLIKLIDGSGSFNGLHKSCSEMSIDEELQKGNLNTSYNRYHFLNFTTYQDWRNISDSRIRLDCSLGFAERYGFRNSYGKSFQPFDFEKNRPFNFIETPLTLMDTTFHRYMKLPADKIGDSIINFYEKNRYNCHHSLLWHNNSFTDYKYGSLLKEYKKVMGYLYENKINTVTPEMIINECSLNW